MTSRRLSDYALIAVALFYGLNLGPMIFESFTSDRMWASNPPDSFHMFLGPYGQQTAHYWRVVSPLAVISFVLSLALNWSNPARRLWLLAFFVAFLSVQIPTVAYFVPEQERLITGAGAIGREALQARADQWIFLNYFRIATGVVGEVLLMLGLLAPRA